MQTTKRKRTAERKITEEGQTCRFITITTYVDENGVIICEEEVNRNFKTIKTLQKNVRKHECTVWTYRTVLVTKSEQLRINFPD